MGLSARTFGWMRDGIGNLAAAREIETHLSLGQVGNVFFCDPSNGSDAANDGASPTSAKATLNAAIGLCTADNGDLIICLPGSHNVTSTVELDVSGITIAAQNFGQNRVGGGENFTINAASSFTNGPAVTVTKPCRVIGMGIAGRQTAGESLLIDCQEAGGFSGGWIEFIDCRFPCWYGAMTHLVKSIGGSGNRLIDCTFDGLFVGVGTSGIGLYNDTGGFAAAYLEVLGCRFHSMGSGKHAIKHATGSVPVNVLYASNYLIGGWSAQGKFLDNNSVASAGVAGDNYHGGANKAAMYENLTNSTMLFAGNHYDDT